MGMEARDLVRRAMAGDADAFSALVRRYQRMIFTYALSKLRDVEEARDATQEIFIEAFKNISSLKSPGSFLPWLRGIASNVCRRRKRRRRMDERLDEIPEPAVLPPIEEELMRSELKDEVLKAILSLPEGYRHVLLLHYFDELPQREVAAFMGISVTAVETRIGRAREMLRKKLGSLPEEEGERRIRVAIIERPMERRARVSPGDVILIYHDLGAPDTLGWSPIRIHGTQGDELKVGEGSEEEAMAR